MDCEIRKSIFWKGMDPSRLSNKGALITSLWEMIMIWWLPPCCMQCHSQRDEDRHIYSNEQRPHEFRVRPMCFTNTISCNEKYTIRSSVEIYVLWAHARHRFCTSTGTLMAKPVKGIMWGMELMITTWWRHQMETFSALLTICAGNSPVTGDFPAQRPVTRIFDVFFDLHLNKLLSKQCSGWWFETASRSLWSHCNEPTEKHVYSFKNSSAGEE